MIGIKSAGKLEESKFPCAVCRKLAGINSIFCKFKCQTYANQQTDKAEDCPGIELNGQSLEIV